MKRLFTHMVSTLLCLAGAAVNTFAQNEPDTAVFSRIKAAELSSSQIPHIAHYLTDVSGPRLANSQGYKRAANWAVATLKKWGLTNAGLEAWGDFGKQWDIDDLASACVYLTRHRCGHILFRGQPVPMVFKVVR